MPRTRSAVNCQTSTAKRVETNPPPEVPKPSREQRAKVVKKPRVKKGKEASGDNTTPHLSVGSNVPLSGDFGGKLHLHDGTKTSLKQLLEKSAHGVIVIVYPKPLDNDADEADEADDLYGEVEHAQLDWESAEMDTISIIRASVSSVAAFVGGETTWMPVISNLNGSLMKAMSITSPKGVFKQGAFIISKTGILLARTMGKTDKIMDDLYKVIFL